MSALQLVSEAEPPLSPAREGLRQAIVDLKSAQGALVETQRPVTALDGAVEAARQAQAELVRLRDERELRVASWLAGGREGERPTESEDEIAAHFEAQRARADADAAERILPAARNRAAQAAAAVNGAAQRRDAAVAAVAGEAAGEMVRAELLPAIEAMLRVEARLQSVRDALFAHGTSPAGNAASQISDLIRQAKAEAGVERDSSVGKALLDALAGDPGAHL